MKRAMRVLGLAALLALGVQLDVTADRLHAHPGDTITLELALLSLLVALGIAIPAGVIAAVRRNTMWDVLASGISLCGVSIPNFWLGIMLILLFAVRLGWLPAAGYASVLVDPAAALRFMVLPAVSLGFNQSALIARIARSCMLEVLQQDYIRTARAKGLRERAVIYGHAFRNALVPVVTVIGITTAILIGGAVVTETVFAWPGIGRLLITAINTRDYPLVQAIVSVAGIDVAVEPDRQREPQLAARSLVAQPTVQPRAD